MRRHNRNLHYAWQHFGESDRVAVDFLARGGARMPHDVAPNFAVNSLLLQGVAERFAHRMDDFLARNRVGDGLAKPVDQLVVEPIAQR